MRHRSLGWRGLAEFALLSLLLAGCGTLSADMHLTFTGDGKLSARMDMTATGMLSNMLAGENSAVGNWDQAVWQTSKEVKGDTLVLTAVTKEPRPVEMVPLSNGAANPFEGMQFAVGGNPFVRSYRASMAMKPSAPQAPTPNALMDEKTMTQMMNAAFKMSLAITMPGEITATNADSKTADTATWVFNYTSLTQGRTIEVESREVQWGAIGGSVAALGGVAVGGVWLRSRGRRDPAAGMAALSAYPDETPAEAAASSAALRGTPNAERPSGGAAE